MSDADFVALTAEMARARSGLGQPLTRDAALALFSLPPGVAARVSQSPVTRRDQGRRAR
jgi:hypothetical protein